MLHFLCCRCLSSVSGWGWGLLASWLQEQGSRKAPLFLQVWAVLPEYDRLPHGPSQAREHSCRSQDFSQKPLLMPRKAGTGGPTNRERNPHRGLAKQSSKSRTQVASLGLATKSVSTKPQWTKALKWLTNLEPTLHAFWTRKPALSQPKMTLSTLNFECGDENFIQLRVLRKAH